MTRALLLWSVAFSSVGGLGTGACRNSDSIVSPPALVSAMPPDLSASVGGPINAAPTGEVSPAAPADAGLQRPKGTDVKCSGDARGCVFRGIVRAIRPIAYKFPVGARIERDLQHVPVRGLEIILDETPSLACAGTELRGVLDAEPEVPGKRTRNGPYPQPEPAPHVGAISVALPSGIELPIAAGDAICGSVRRWTLGYDLGRDALIARPNGDVLLAWSNEMPRETAPLGGWRFVFGALRRGDLEHDSGHDMIVTHGSVSTAIPSDDEVHLVKTPDGVFGVVAGGYVVHRSLPTHEAWRSARGYGFTIVRVGGAPR